MYESVSDPFPEHFMSLAAHLIFKLQLQVVTHYLGFIKNCAVHPCSKKLIIDLKQILCFWLFTNSLNCRCCNSNLSLDLQSVAFKLSSF